MVESCDYDTISNFVKNLKGSSSHEANTRNPRSAFCWQSGYGVSTVSEHNVSIIRNYTLNQEKHHNEI